MNAARSAARKTRALRPVWGARLAFLLIVATAAVTVWLTNIWMTDRFTADTRARAEVRSTLYAGNIISELQRTSVVPLLLSRDPAIISSLATGDFAATSQRLISYQDEIEAASLILLDSGGRTVAATDRSQLGTIHRNHHYFIEAIRSNGTVFVANELETGAFSFTYSRRIEFEKEGLGVIVVEADLNQFEDRWSAISNAVLISNSEGRVMLSTEGRWVGRTLEEALDDTSPPSALARALNAAGEWSSLNPDAYFRGQAIMQTDIRIPFQGWNLTTFTSYASVRDQVNGILALEIMAFAIILALAFYFLSRRAQSKSLFFQRESADLRQLNDALQREIAERKRVEKTLEVAEQTLAQSSKLAALGEMSAAVSHELNQPLAAMKTYLAGAKLLLQRRRPSEALSSFQRIDDLIERMGAITRQLKSYARKGDEAFEPIDMRVSVSSALAMMEPQLKQIKVTITNQSPSEPVMVEADPLRLEQVIVNLLRNALDAVGGVTDPRVDLILSAGEVATLTVRDNGVGIDDLDALFEPFYTTKRPGDGVGLGLAISSGIVNDLGGRLRARNSSTHGAVFEVELPILSRQTEAAE